MLKQMLSSFQQQHGVLDQYHIDKCIHANEPITGGWKGCDSTSGLGGTTDKSNKKSTEGLKKISKNQVMFRVNQVAEKVKRVWNVVAASYQ